MERTVEVGACPLGCHPNLKRLPRGALFNHFNHFSRPRLSCSLSSPGDKPPPVLIDIVATNAYTTTTLPIITTFHITATTRINTPPTATINTTTTTPTSPPTPTPPVSPPPPLPPPPTFPSPPHPHPNPPPIPNSQSGWPKRFTTSRGSSARPPPHTPVPYTGKPSTSSRALAALTTS